MSLSPLRNFGASIGFKHISRVGSMYGADENGNEDVNFVQVLSGLMTFTTGIFLTGVRFAEPLIRVLCMESMYGFFGELYEPKLSDAHGIEELRRQDKALSQILTSSLNVELVYVVLKSITSFSQNDTLSGRLSGNVEGVVFSEVQERGHEAPITEIDMNAPGEKFMRQAEAECAKKRTVTLQQIEIKMVDNFADKRISEFMSQGNFNQTNLAAGRTERSDTVTTSKASQGRLR